MQGDRMGDGGERVRQAAPKLPRNAYPDASVCYASSQTVTHVTRSHERFHRLQVAEERLGRKNIS